MKITHREELISDLNRRSQEIINSKKIDEMILIHEIMISRFYSKKPLFYKMVFKHVRFYTTTVLFSIYFCKPNPTLKLVKDFIIHQEKLTSVNTLNSLLIQLHVSGRLEMFRNESNRRESLYRPSQKVFDEIHELIQSLLRPYQIIHGDNCNSCEKNVERFISLFFSRYGDLVLNHISMVNLLPEAALFLEKDAGHMIMLILYKEYVEQKSQRIILSHKRIAKYSHVSRTHVCSLLKEAQTAGFVIVENNLFIGLSDKFITLFRRYFSLYMAQILYSVGHDL